jgi:hypothetical protein
VMNMETESASTAAVIAVVDAEDGGRRGEDTQQLMRNKLLNDCLVIFIEIYHCKFFFFYKFINLLIYHCYNCQFVLLLA